MYAVQLRSVGMSIYGTLFACDGFVSVCSTSLITVFFSFFYALHLSSELSSSLTPSKSGRWLRRSALFGRPQRPFCRRGRRQQLLCGELLHVIMPAHINSKETGQADFVFLIHSFVSYFFNTLYFLNNTCFRVFVCSIIGWLVRRGRLHTIVLFKQKWRQKSTGAVHPRFRPRLHLAGHHAGLPHQPRYRRGLRGMQFSSHKDVAEVSENKDKQIELNEDS